jgi:hypothetical protein
MGGQAYWLMNFHCSFFWRGVPELTPQVTTEMVRHAEFINGRVGAAG